METHIGTCLAALAGTIADRRGAGDASYTYRLLTGKSDDLFKKVMEEAGEVALAGKDLESLQGTLAFHKHVPSMPEGATSSLQQRAEAARDHLRYEAADEVYHLLVLLERYGIGLDELAAELYARMTPEERPAGEPVIEEGHVNRGK